jgi:hypothetical protein
MEGVKRHLESLVSTLAANRTVHTLWNIPVSIVTLKYCLGPFINYISMILAIFDFPYPHVKLRKIVQTLPPILT